MTSDPPAAPAAADAAVRAQYEALPYPARDPRDEAKRLVTGSPSHILEIDHYLFAGRRDWSAPFRALIAGGGTGDAAIMLAQQLADRGTPAELIHLDLSRAAQAVAAARAKARGLTNLRFVNGSLLDAPSLGLGMFDYIDCCGVLHHLADPAAGLAALAAVLAPEGGMGIMVYGEYGRIGVYHMQEMLRHFAPEGEPPAARVAGARKLLAQLPPTNWFRRNPFLGDHRQGGDAGLYDLLLHSRDRAYRVPELAALVDGARLRVVTFIEAVRYDPATYLTDPALLRRLEPLSMIERAAVAESLAGNLRKHAAYLTWASRGETVARPEGPEAVPILRDLDGEALARRFKPGGAFTADLDGIPWKVALPRLAGAMLTRIDGRRTLGDIHAELRTLDSGLDWAGFKRQFDQLYAVLHAANRLMLRLAP